ncbi:MAG TPA: SRPBCC domain-containing protein [Verrucomicrobiae bacterium]|nr:SRPBCC domain-containing protein [Verrucomicrobiae bacterium]
MTTQIQAAKDCPRQKIIITRELDAPCALVFSAWTDARHLSSWFSPENVECRSFDADIRVGGAYRLHMVSQNGNHIAFGKYKEITPNQRLRFTWEREDTPALSTLVTVEFEDLGRTTRLTLTHEGFSELEDAADHNEGWTSLLEKFVRLMKQNKIATNKITK